MNSLLRDTTCSFDKGPYQRQHTAAVVLKTAPVVSHAAPRVIDPVNPLSQRVHRAAHFDDESFLLLASIVMQ